MEKSKSEIFVLLPDMCRLIEQFMKIDNLKMDEKFIQKHFIIISGA